MENKELINIETYDECGKVKPLDESVISFLQILMPKPTLLEANGDEPLSYKNCNSFELIYDNRHPQILYYLGDYMYDAEPKPSRLLYNPISFDGTTVGDSGDLVESYKACEAIKKWAENTMYLIGEKCVKEINDKLHEKVDEYGEESKKHILDELYRLGKEEYEKEKDQPTLMPDDMSELNINNKN